MMTENNNSPRIAKAYKDLTFTDNFMFCKVLYNNEGLCKDLIELLLGVEVDHIVYKDREHEIKETSDSRGIRLDVHLRDEEGTVFDLEMQNAIVPALAKRTRYYQSMIDIEYLPAGADFDELPDSYIVFICMFDPYDKGLHKYEFRELCLQDKTIELGSGASKVFINAKSREEDMSEDMRAFLDYLRGEEARSEMTKNIAKSIENAKNFKPWEVEYIGYNLKMAEERQAGREEGIEEKGFDAVDRLVAAGMADEERACEVLGVDIEAYRKYKEDKDSYTRTVPGISKRTD